MPISSLVLSLKPEILNFFRIHILVDITLCVCVCVYMCVLVCLCFPDRLKCLFDTVCSKNHSASQPDEQQQEGCYDSPCASFQASLQVSDFTTHSLVFNCTEYHWFLTLQSMHNISFLSLFISPWDGRALALLIQGSRTTWPAPACNHNLLYLGQSPGALLGMLLSTSH